MSPVERRQWLLLAVLFQSACEPDDTAHAAGSEYKSQARKVWRRYQEQQDPGGIVSDLNERRYPTVIRRQLDACERWCEQPNHQVLTRHCPAYPPLLATIPDSPPLLFVQGNPQILGLPQVAVVGSRKPTSAGRQLATRFGCELSQAGYAVTSGLALGIDAASHEGALQGGGRTIAVLGSGLDTLYPKRNADLAARICEKGALVSELLPDAGPLAWHFPRRNRLISGMSHGVLVVEAALSSGSLITARMAAEQGREIFAVPGPITNPLSRGCHRLLRQGAVLVEGIDDIVAELGGLLQWEHGRSAPDTSPPRAPLGKLEQTVLAQIAYNPVSLDELAGTLALEMGKLLPCLLQLELDGFLECRAGNYSRRA
jgi:DNA processing protein